MGSEWKSYMLSDVINIIGGGTPKRNVSEYWGGDIPWLSVKDFNDNQRHVFVAEEKITEEGLNHSSTKMLYPGQLIISARGTVGALAQIITPMAFNQSCYGIDAKPEFAINDFLYYLMKYTISNLQQITHGAVFDTITRETFNHVDVKIPSFPEQRAVANILGSLDDKIELNRKMNETLEAMARASFKSWFVDFDPVRAKVEGRDPGLPQKIADLFPDSLESSELGEIPKGWGTKSLYEWANFINGKSFRNIDFSEDNSGLPIIKIAELKNGISGQTKFTLNQYDEKYRINDGEILFSWSGSPDTSIDAFLWTLGPGWLNQHIFKVLPHRKEEKEFVYFLLKYLRPTFIAIAYDKQTTGLGHVTVKDMKNMQIILPAKNAINAFNNEIRPIYNQVLNNFYESQSLNNLRDTLLPKLISGELRIPDVEKFIKEAGI